MVADSSTVSGAVDEWWQRYNGDWSNAAITYAWASNSTDKSQSEIYDSVRQKLIFYDRQAQEIGRQNSEGCTCGDIIDFYHDQAFEESGLDPLFYGGNLWPKSTWPNPVPYDPQGNDLKDDLFK